MIIVKIRYNTFKYSNQSDCKLLFHYADHVCRKIYSHYRAYKQRSSLRRDRLVNKLKTKKSEIWR